MGGTDAWRRGGTRSARTKEERRGGTGRWVGQRAGDSHSLVGWMLEGWDWEKERPEERRSRRRRGGQWVGRLGVSHCGTTGLGRVHWERGGHTHTTTHSTHARHAMHRPTQATTTCTVYPRRRRRRRRRRRQCQRYYRRSCTPTTYHNYTLTITHTQQRRHTRATYLGNDRRRRSGFVDGRPREVGGGRVATTAVSGTELCQEEDGERQPLVGDVKQAGRQKKEGE